MTFQLYEMVLAFGGGCLAGTIAIFVAMIVGNRLKSQSHEERALETMRAFKALKEAHRDQ